MGQQNIKATKPIFDETGRWTEKGREIELALCSTVKEIFQKYYIEEGFCPRQLCLLLTDHIHYAMSSAIVRATFRKK